MSMFRTISILAVMFCAAGCRPGFEISPPTGFAEVSRSTGSARFKGREGVGLHLRRFDNVPGGTLAYWSDDLIRKLARRGYLLEAQQPISSKNRVVGTKFDFHYQDPLEGTEKFYRVALFVTDKHLIAVQLAGDREHAATEAKALEGVAADLRVHGCKVGKKICRGEQPESLLELSKRHQPEPSPPPGEETPAPPQGEQALASENAATDTKP